MLKKITPFHKLNVFVQTTFEVKKMNANTYTHFKNQLLKMKEQAEAKSERDLLEVALVVAMQKDTYGKITKENLDTELDKEPGNDKYKSEQLGDNIRITFVDSGRSYVVDSKGNIMSQ